jgi:hypothetical protein
MKKLHEAMLNHMRYIILAEKRPFSYLDFGSFIVQGKEYSVKHGTFRNKICRLVRDGIAELDYKSNVAFYTLTGTNFGKKKKTMTPIMTPNHMGVDSVTETNSVIMNDLYTCPPICNIIRDLPQSRNALHDIHYKFEVPDTWNTLYYSKKYRPNAVSKDIPVYVLNTEQLKIITTVHRTDTVTVVVACSVAPVAVDTFGLLRLSNALTRLEERLSRIIDECGSLLPGGYESIPIPPNDTWEVTMWHFGYDSPTEYTGPRFCATWKDGQGALARAYSKNMKSGTRVRSELQEYPRKRWRDVVARGHRSTGGDMNKR